MKNVGAWTALAAVLLGAGAGRSPAQDPGTPVEVAVDEDFAAMRGRILAFVGALVDYTNDVRVGAADLDSILDHYDSLEAIHGDGGGGELLERAFREGRYDFDVIVDDPAYAAWCRERGLEPGPFFRALASWRAVDRTWACPARCCTVTRSAPASRRSAMNVRRRSFGLDPRSPACRARFRQMR